MKNRAGELTNTKDGILEGLKNEAGVIPSPALPKPKRAKSHAHLDFEQLSGRVRQARPPVQSFKCDDCRFHSYGWQEMTNHVDKTGHLNFTAEDRE